MMKLIALISFILMSTNSFSFIHGMLFHRQSLSFQKSIPGVLGQKFFDQKLDHNDPDNSKTFKQRYFVNSQYAENNFSPVFLIICGEWNCAGTGSYGFTENLAKKLKAHLVALEHRYYGESLPMTNLTTENLKFLNLESAIQDLANFQRFMMNEKNLKGKWISFGGSYAGTLSAFYRLKHPELLSGALASSGPVFMKPDFYEYDAHIAKVLNKTTCGDKVRKTVALIEEKMKTSEGVAELKKIFKATEIRDSGDFIYVVADMLAAAVQYGRDKVFCDSLLASTDLVAGYAKGGLAVLSSLGSSPLDSSFQVAENEEVTPEDMFRQWMWQSCQEFGWFQVANGVGEGTSRSSMIDLKYHERVCERLYKTPMVANGSMNTDWYNTLFDPSTSKIIFTNGSNDPWLTLSVTELTQESNPDLPLFMMEGAAHCSDLKSFTSIPSVIAAQVRMEKIIKNWLD